MITMNYDNNELWS